MYANGYMDLPGVQYTGDPVTDDALYAAAKAEWYKKNGGMPV